MCGVPGYAWLSREQSGSQSRGICCVWGLPLCLPARGWTHGGLLRLCCSHRYSIFGAPETWTEDARGEHSFPEDFWDLQWNHEEPETGRRAGLHRLFLCLIYNFCHRHPTGGWVLTLCFSTTPIHRCSQKMLVLITAVVKGTVYWNSKTIYFLITHTVNIILCFILRYTRRYVWKDHVVVCTFWVMSASLTKFHPPSFVTVIGLIKPNVPLSVLIERYHYIYVKSCRCFCCFK